MSYAFYGCVSKPAMLLIIQKKKGKAKTFC